MLRIRLKMGPSVRNKEWTCCFGLHVRTATIIIGIWHLFLNLLALGILSVIIRTNNYHLLLDDLNDTDDDGNEPLAPILPTPLSKVDPPYAYLDRFQQSGLHSNDVDMSGLVFLCMIGVTLMLIYGAVKGKPSHLLPFFCLQIFDFAIATLTAANHLCYIRSLHLWITERQSSLPWREELVKLSPQTLSVLVLIGFILFIFLKAYAIGIVWRCYKFLTFRQHNLRSMLPYIIPDTPNTANRQERDNNSLLPDYDEAVAQSLKQAPPPSYVVAMAMNNKTVTPAEEPITEENTINLPDNDSLTDPPPYNSVESAEEQNNKTLAVENQVSETQKQLDYYKAQVALLGLNRQPDVDPLPLENQPKYEKYPSSPDFMLTDEGCFTQQLDSKYADTSVFGNKVYSCDQNPMEDSSEPFQVSKDPLLQLDKLGFGDEF